MATKRFSPPTKFRVGQRFVLVMDKHTGCASMDCQFGVVDGPPAYSDAWSCGSIDGSREDGSQSGWRYPVRVPGRPLQHFCEEHMRPIDGEELSTWDKFAKATGIDLRGAIIDLRASQEGTPPREAVSQMHSPVQLDEERTALAREITYQLEPIFKELVDLSSRATRPSRKRATRAIWSYCSEL